MKIGELAERTGVTTKTIRFYEKVGLLPEPPRAANGYRTYDEAAVERLRFIKDAQATGLTLTEIASIMELRGRGEATCHHVVGLLERHLASLDRHIEALHRTRAQLALMTERAKSLDPANCTDPIRCQTIGTTSGVGAIPGAHIHGGPHAHDHR